MHDRVIAGFDGSAVSRDAVMWAAQEAALRKAVLEVVSCFNVPLPVDHTVPLAYGPMGVDAFRDACERRLDAMVPSVHLLHPGLAVERWTTPEHPADVLIDRSEACDLVVVGNSGRTGFRALLLGSVAHAVTRHSKCPVAIVRQEVPDHAGVVGVGIDGSPASDAALDWAIDEADRRGARLLVVHAWEPMFDVENSWTWPATQEVTEIDAARVLDRAVERANERGGAAVMPRLTRDLPWHALLTASREVDLLVVGSHGRGAVRSRLLGSVAHAVTQTARCPVVIARSATAHHHSG